MNAERLLELYEQIGEAPDAIARLRRFVLDLAVRGKLVEQDPEDEPALELLKRVAVEKALLAEAGKIRKQKPFAAVDQEPFEVPRTWQWVRLGELGTTQTGSTPPKSRQDYYGLDIPFIRPGDLYPDHVDYSGKGLTRLGAEASGRLVQNGSLLMVCIGTVGKCQIVDRLVSFNQQINTLSPFSNVASRYILSAFQSDYFQDAAWQASARTTIAILNKGNWEKLPIPLPPLGEQHRIVAKVDELMALCDRLEEARKTREETRDKLTAATLARLTAPEAKAASETDGTNVPSGAAPNQAEPENAGTGSLSGTATAQPSDFPTHARFAIETLPALTSRPDQIKSLRQTILNLAVRGKLVEQDAADEPAQETLTRLFEARRKLEEQGRILKVKKIPTLSDPVFEAPRGWEWCPLVAICDVVDPNPSHRMPRYVASGGQPFISSQNFIDDDNIDYSIGKRVDMATVEEQISRFSILEGAFGFSRIGTIGKTRPLSQERDYAISHAVCVVNPVSVDDLSMRFLRLAMGAEIILKYAHHGTRSVGVPDLGMGVIRSMGIALPPLAEQRRIVAKVDTLMALCDRLEAALTAADTIRTRLLEALLHEALEPAEKTLEAAE